MIEVIVGRKGTGKTKRLIEMVNDSLKNAKGDILVIEKGGALTLLLPHKVRLADVDAYNINSYDRMYGFIAGMMAGNYDIERIYIDAILKVGGRDYEALSVFLDRIEGLAQKEGVDVIFTVSEDIETLPPEVLKYMRE